jgi:hypothetical protein
VVKTYALGGLLVTGGFLALTAPPSSRGGRRAWTAAAGVLMALAAGTRISLVMTLPVVFLWLAVERYRIKREACPWAFALGAAGTLCAVFGPFLLAAPRAVWFGMVEYHAGREAGSLVLLLAYKAAFILRTIRAYFIPIALLLAALFARRSVVSPGAQVTASRETDSPLRGSAVRLFGCSPVRTPLLLSIAVVTLAHFMAPFPYEDYQALIFPLFAVAVAVSVARYLARVRVRFLLLLLCLMAAFASPRCQDWFAAPRDRIWWPMRPQSALAQLRELGRELRNRAGPDGLLLTQDTYLAVEAGLRVPAGMEMGPFCYFPEWPRERAEACHVLNRDMLTERLAGSEAAVAAFSEYGLAIASPAVRPVSDAEVARLVAIVESRYALAATIPAFGQAQTELKIYLKR